MKQTVRKFSRAGVVAALVLVASGCNRPLLSPAETRTPFDSYDSVRGQYAPQTLTDDLGRDKPNIRQRLSTKD
ncbi:MAG TPA: hypothetical protein VEB22_03085 [Phycisphaerales bacterium]|nr:hypothetical protein [Phycisphaerales bacterium]